MTANAMSVDVEDYFQVSAFAGTISRDSWDSLECRVESNTLNALSLFEEHDVKATFFVLGWVAERYPALIREIVGQGHELACHGFGHEQITVMDQSSFREDIHKAKAMLEDLGGVAVKGYRAPSYSINKSTLWALDILKDENFEYSSSIYPVKHDLYGIPDAPRAPFEHSNGLKEIPISTVELMGRNWPCGGGGFFRLYPYQLSRWLLHKSIEQTNSPVNFYYHPWELDPDQPLQKEAPLRSRFRHYLNLSRMRPRLQRLLNDFSWGRMDQVYFQDNA